MRAGGRAFARSRSTVIPIAPSSGVLRVTRCIRVLASFRSSPRPPARARAGARIPRAHESNTPKHGVHNQRAKITNALSYTQQRTHICNADYYYLTSVSPSVPPSVPLSSCLPSRPPIFVPPLLPHPLHSPIPSSFTPFFPYPCFSLISVFLFFLSSLLHHTPPIFPLPPLYPPTPTLSVSVSLPACPPPPACLRWPAPAGPPVAATAHAPAGPSTRRSSKGKQRELAMQALDHLDG